MKSILPAPWGTPLVLSACLGLCACGIATPAATQAGTATVREAEVSTQPGGLSGSAFQQAVAQGQAQLVFAYVPAPGFAYLDEDGRPTGVTVELLRDFAQWVATTHDLAVDVSWHEQASWSTFYEQVRDAEGGVFGVGNVTITGPRQAELDFSPPYMSNIATLVTHESVPDLADMERIGEQFSALTGLVFPGTLHETRLETIRRDHFPGLATRPVESNDELVALLAADEGYFGYVDIYNFWRAEQAGQPLRRHPVGDDASEAFGVILPDSSDWTTVLGEFFDADEGYVRSARFQDHMRRHLGEGLAELLLEP